MKCFFLLHWVVYSGDAAHDSVIRGGSRFDLVKLPVSVQNRLNARIESAPAVSLIKDRMTVWRNKAGDETSATLHNTAAASLW